MDSAREELVASATRLDSRLSTDHLDLFLEEIFKWNPQLGLVSKQTPAQVLERLIRQSIDMWNRASVQADPGVPSFVDVGSGGGFPGMIWAMLSPESSGLLVERKERKAGFLERVISLLGFERIEIFSGDARGAADRKQFAGAFDIGVAMAVGSPDSTGPLLEPFLREGGVFVTTHGKDGDAGAESVGAHLKLVSDTRTENEAYLLYKCHRLS
jgi:16S rRNA (guanine527-N7)-methyltransferase